MFPMTPYLRPLPPDRRDDPHAQRLQLYLARWLPTHPGWAWTTDGPSNTLPWARSLRHRSADEVARELAQDVDFLAVGLADWLRSPDGELITAVIATLGLLPPEAQLLIDAVRLAGDLQHASGQGRAGALAGAALLVTAAILILGSP